MKSFVSLCSLSVSSVFSLSVIGAATSKQLSVKPAKVVAGHEPEKTNELLQALAQAIGSKVSKLVNCL